MGQLYSDISKWAIKTPSQLAFCSGELRCSYAELIQRVDQVAQKLSELGVSRGALLSFQLPSGLDFLILLLAAIKQELLVAPIADGISNRELQKIIKSLAPTHFLSIDSIKSKVSGIEQVELDDFLLTTFEQKLKDEVLDVCPNGGCVRYTSGTTGLAKGVLISQEAAYARIVAADAFFRLEPGDRVLSLLAMPYHFVVSILNFLRAGACIVRPKNSAPSEMVRCFEQENCDLMYAAPFHYDVLVGAAKKQDLNFRLVVSTSTTLRQETAMRFHSKFGLRIADSYGIIELGIPISVSDSADLRWGVIGTALPGYEVCVHNESGFSQFGRGTLMIKGPGLFDAYLDPFASCCQVLKNGWFETGDLAEIDESGQIRIYGRRNSAIHIAGFKVFPEEIESVLLEHDSVSDVQVQGVQHPSFGNTIHAKVVCSTSKEVSTEQLTSFCRSKLGNLKTPHSFEFASHLERTSTGKLKRQ